MVTICPPDQTRWSLELTRHRHVFGFSNSNSKSTSNSDSNSNLQSEKVRPVDATHQNASKIRSGRASPNLNVQSPTGTATLIAGSLDSSDNSSDDSNEDATERASVPVVAMVSTHALREERAYHICKNLSRTCDPEGNHIARPLDHLRLSAQPGDTAPIVVTIFEAPGPNALAKYMDFGPAWYRGGDSGSVEQNPMGENSDLIDVSLFLDFAVGATECLELMHHGQRIIHGELRGDAFHFLEESGQVRLINFGSGLRSFEHGLTSAGWAALSAETDAKTKLSYISPEQTRRMGAEPDSRSDIYSLGILFWTLLTKQPAFDGETPMDIIQGVLGRRLPSVSSIRMDVPDIISKIIEKMSAKAVSERYKSVSGLRYDLLEVQRLLGDGNLDDLENWEIATKDVSSFFILPTVMIGRSEEHNEIVKIIDKVAKRHISSQKQGTYSLSSGSSVAIDLDLSSENSSRAGDGRRNSAIALPYSGHGTTSNSNPSYMASAASSQYNSQDSVHSNGQIKPWEKNTSLSQSIDARSALNGEGEGSKSVSDGAASLTSQRNKQKFRRQGRCEVISIDGAAGLGKSCLVQSVQVEARRRGYFASSKFDQTKQTAFGPVLKLLSSLFKQVFSESVTDTPFHQVLKQYVRPVWPMVSTPIAKCTLSYARHSFVLLPAEDVALLLLGLKIW
jgi:serine/threonine protein kinase